MVCFNLVAWLSLTRSSKYNTYIYKPRFLGKCKSLECIGAFIVLVIDPQHRHGDYVCIPFLDVLQSMVNVTGTWPMLNLRSGVNLPHLLSYQGKEMLVLIIPSRNMLCHCMIAGSWWVFFDCRFRWTQSNFILHALIKPDKPLLVRRLASCSLISLLILLAFA